MEIRAPRIIHPTIGRSVGVLATCILAALVANGVLLLGSETFPNIDLLSHYRWVSQFTHVLQEGTLYPRWMPWSNNGFGEPTFLIYQPLYFYCAAALNMITGDAWVAMRLLSFASTLCIALLGFWILSRYCEFGIALTGAVLLAVQPFSTFLTAYHAAYPWQFSLAIALSVLYFSLRRTSRFIDVPVSASVALLTLAHVLVSFMVMVCLAITLLVGRRGPGERGKWIALLSWGLSAGLGLALAGVYLIPALDAPRLISLHLADDPVFINWRNSFAFPTVTAGIYGIRWFGMQWVLAVVPAAILAASVLLLRRTGTSGCASNLASGLTLASMVALLLSSELSFPIYAASALFRRVQWPYRFLTIATIASALALPLIVGATRESSRPVAHRALVTALALSLLVLAVIQYRLWVEGGEPRLGASVLQRFVGQRGFEPATAGQAWKETDAHAILEQSCRRPEVRHCATLLDQAHHRIWEVTLDHPARMLFPLFAFPAWRATIDTVPVQSGIDPDLGVIVIAVPAGRHLVGVEWAPLPPERIGAAVSLLAAGVLALALLWQKYRVGPQPLGVQA